MQKTVESTKSEVKEELREKEVQGHEKRIKINITDLLNKYSGNPEMWAIWYSKVYKGFLDSTDRIFETPLDTNDTTVDDIFSSLRGNCNFIIEKMSNQNEYDAQPMISMRNRIREFQKNEDDEITVILSIHGSSSSLEYLNTYIPNGYVTVDLDRDDQRPTEEVSLREHKSEITDSFSSWTPYQNRPNNRYKRTLYISFKKEGNNLEATVDIETQRMKYTLMEKAFRLVGMSTPYKTDALKELEENQL